MKQGVVENFLQNQLEVESVEETAGFETFRDFLQDAPASVRVSDGPLGYFLPLREMTLKSRLRFRAEKMVENKFDLALREFRIRRDGAPGRPTPVFEQ